MSFYVGASGEVARHYNLQQESSKKDVRREDTAIFPLRNFNNLVKSCLISQFGVRGSAVLDLCGGRGGDLFKYIKALRPSYITIVDVALFSLMDAAKRYNKYLAMARRDPAKVIAPPPLDLVWADTFYHTLPEHFTLRMNEGFEFSLASCQFALHYSWETESRARKLLENVAGLLAPHHYFVATFPSKEQILARAQVALEEAGAVSSIGNDFYRIEFSEELTPDRLEQIRAASFGVSYKFFLADAIDTCEEYFVDLPVLKAIALECGLHLEAVVLFRDFEATFLNSSGRYYRPQHAHAFQSFNRRVEGGISLDAQSPDLREAIELYCAAIFVRQPRERTPALPHQITRFPPAAPLNLGSVCPLYGARALEDELMTLDERAAPK
eukprot:gnl/Chilomastix_cuspidata/2191.p1 GENE.gnl/Chilomastix_cuspidata/2191~~gnl/Chilomastix_cuspidata/2191.p1  ORF type:complete len:383 (+),score=177.37 gnl/Chilomastix_cuspidata/2191:1398-2546(+)